MPKPLQRILAALAITVGLLAQPAYADLRVHTYSSPDPDSVNTFAVETARGLVIISTQRTLSEAHRAVARIKRIGQPVAAIVIPVPHTDHFGGLGVFRDAFPRAKVYGSEATIKSLSTDGQRYIASRKAALGDDFPSQEQVIAALPEHFLKNGDKLDFGDVTFTVLEVSNANAPSNTMLYAAEQGVLFSVEVVEDGVSLFLKDADLKGWIEVLKGMRAQLPGVKTLYGAHNASAPAGFAIAQQIAHLEAYRNALIAALSDGEMSDTERAGAIADIDARFLDHARVARLERAKLIGLNLDWQVQKLQTEMAEESSLLTH